MIVTPALFALTLKVHMFAVAFEDMRAMAKPVQVGFQIRLDMSLSFFRRRQARISKSI